MYEKYKSGHDNLYKMWKRIRWNKFAVQTRDEMKPIKVIRNKCGDFWNPNDGKETYSRDIVKLLNILNIPYELKDETVFD